MIGIIQTEEVARWDAESTVRLSQTCLIMFEPGFILIC